MTQQHLYKQIVDAGPDGIAVIGPKGIIETCNDAFCRLSGIERTALQGTSVQTLAGMFDTGVPDLLTYFQSLLTNDVKEPVPCTCRHSGGSLRFGEAFVRRIGEDAPQKGFILFIRDVTSRHLEKEQLRFQSGILDQISDSITVTDPDGIITYVNHAAAALLGKPREALLGSSVTGFGSSRDQIAQQEEIIRIVREEGSWRGEVVNVDPKGRETLFDSRITLIRGEQGRPAALCGISTNITEQKHSDLRLKLALEGSGAALWEVDVTAGTILLEQFDSWTNLLGYTQTDFPDLTMEQWLELIHPDDRDSVNNTFSALLQNSNPVFNAEYRMRHKQGRWVWVNARGKVTLTDAEGRPLRVSGTHISIAGRKAAEEQLAASESRYRLLAETTGDIIVLHDKHGIINYMNRAGLSFLGTSRKEIIGANVRDFLSGDELHNVQKRQTARLKGESGRTSYETAFINKKGAKIIVDISSTPLYDDGDLSAVLLVARDITKRKETETELLNRNTFIQTVLDNLPIGIALNTFKEGSATYMNSRFEEIYGWDREILVDIGRFFATVYPDSEYRKKTQKRIEDDIASGDPKRMHWQDIVITRSDGSTRIVDAVNIPLPEQNTMVSTVIDMTGQKQTEQALRESEKTLKKAQEIGRQGSWQFDLKTGLVKKSEQCARIYGVDYRREYTVKDIQKLPLPEYRPALDKALRDLVEGTAEYNVEFRIRRPKDNQIVDIHSVAEYDPANQTVTGILQDISERKKTERDIEEKMKELTQFNKLMVGRELRMADLKQEINDLCRRLNIPPEYPGPQQT